MFSPNTVVFTSLQIARNKGLTPKRKKEQRNPRVKHKKKYEKAKRRRTGQIRPVVTEEGVYGGRGEWHQEYSQQEHQAQVTLPSDSFVTILYNILTQIMYISHLQYYNDRTVSECSPLFNVIDTLTVIVTRIHTFPNICTSIYKYHTYEYTCMNTHTYVHSDIVYLHGMVYITYAASVSCLNLA